MNKSHIIGADECGYGSLAGPLLVCAVKTQNDWSMEGLNDSKKLSAKKRNTLRIKLLSLVEQGIIQYAMAERSNLQIDSLGVYVALKDAYAECYKKLYDEQSLLIADGNIKFDELSNDGYNITSVIKADTIYPTVMAASILAKTYRDNQMISLHTSYQIYDWINNMGYGAPLHLAAIKLYGPSSLHRMSYAPMKNMEIINSKQTSFKNL
jgi:ribonuclease HII